MMCNRNFAKHHSAERLHEANSCLNERLLDFGMCSRFCFLLVRCTLRPGDVFSDSVQMLDISHFYTSGGEMSPETVEVSKHLHIN